MTTKIPNIRTKLLSLLSPTKFRSTEEIVDTFAQQHPADWKHLIELYGSHAKETKERYTATTYLGNRLWQMTRMGLVELKHTLEFDNKRWAHLKRMGTWRRLAQAKAPEPTHALTVTLPKPGHTKLVLIARSVASTAADLLLSAIEKELTNNNIRHNRLTQPRQVTPCRGETVPKTTTWKHQSTEPSD